MSKDWVGDQKSIYVTLGASNHSEGDRQEDDFYATQASTVNALIDKLEEYGIDLKDKIIVEPAAGAGDILKTFWKRNDGYNKFLAYDIVDRGCPNCEITDFLSVEELPEESKAIVTNPPYAIAKEFVEHSLGLLETGEYCIMLLKIQFLEGKARRKLFETKQLKHVWVFSERQKCLKNNEDTGGSSAVCYAWYIWQKDFEGQPTIDWI